jgi:hypothetical protein
MIIVGLRSIEGVDWRYRDPGTTTPAGRNTAMIMLDRLRRRRTAARQARAIDRAVRIAPSRSAREEILFFVHRRDF